MAKKKQSKGNVLTESKNGPFYIGQQDEKFYVLLGNQVITNKTFKTTEDAEKYISEKPYELLINVMFAVTKQFNEYEKINQKTKENHKSDKVEE